MARNGMNFPVTVGADADGYIEIGAHNCGKCVTTAKRYGSQIPYVISARTKDGKIVITTRRAAKEIGAELLWSTR